MIDGTFSAYQAEAAKTAIFPKEGFMKISYPALGLAGEAGEVADCVKKAWRDHEGKITPEIKAEIQRELGDVLWYVATCCTVLDLNMAEVAKENIWKLWHRNKRGTISGSGNER